MNFLLQKQKHQNKKMRSPEHSDENVPEDELNETDPMKSFHNSDILMPEILYGNNNNEVFD